MLLAAIPLGGCASPEAARTPTTAPAVASDGVTDTDAGGEDLSNTDPCATRLHDLSGQLLLYYYAVGDLPPSLADLDEFDQTGLKSPPPTCPKTGQPYVYNPSGIYLPETQNYVIVYDAAPVHAGHRWAILAREGTDTQGPTMKVLPLPERFFALRPPGQ